MTHSLNRASRAIAIRVADEDGTIIGVTVWGSSLRSLEDPVIVDLDDVPQLVRELQEILAAAESRTL